MEIILELWIIEPYIYREQSKVGINLSQNYLQSTRKGMRESSLVIKPMDKARHPLIWVPQNSGIDIRDGRPSISPMQAVIIVCQIDLANPKLTADMVTQFRQIWLYTLAWNPQIEYQPRSPSRPTLIARSTIPSIYPATFISSAALSTAL